MRVDFEWNKPVSQIAKEIINSDVQLFLANECKRQMEPYVPAQNLILAQNVSVYTEDDRGIVEYRSPYSHYQWEGELYVSSITGSPWASEGEHKVPAGKPLNQSRFRHPLATSHWEKAMWTAKGDAVTQAVQRYLGGRK